MENNISTKMEALDYHYQNAGQFRAIAKSLGYKEQYKDGELTFTRGEESHRHNLNELKKGSQMPGRDDMVLQSQERVSTFFNKNEATSNFQEYSQLLDKDKGLSIVKWDGIKQDDLGTQKDGFTIIDKENKVAYTGAELYKHAYETNKILDGKDTKLDIPMNDLKKVGVDPEKLNPETIENIKKGHKSDLIPLSLDDTQANRDLLKKENVPYNVHNGQLNFEGKVALNKTLTADNLPETKAALKKNEIDFNETGNKINIEGINVKKFAMIALTLVSPVAGIAFLMVPKREDIKNDMALSKHEISALKVGDVVSKTNAKNETVLMQLDKDTNELVRVKSRNISIPNQIDGVQLSPMQKEQLKGGKEITLDKGNKHSTVKIDLNNPNGLSVNNSNLEKSQSLNIEPVRTKEIDPSKLTTDKERLHFIAQNGMDGIDKIFKNSPNNLIPFLEKHNLAKEYTLFNKLTSQYNLDPLATSPTTKDMIGKSINNVEDQMKGQARDSASKLSNSENLSAGAGYGKPYAKSLDNSSKLKI